MRNIYVILIFVLTISCNSSKRIFENFNTSSDNVKIYVLPMHLNLDEESCPLLIKNGILIDDQEIINNILNEWVYHEKVEPDFPEFKVYILKENDLYYNFSFNRCLDQIKTVRGSFLFKPNDLLKYINYFKPVIGIRVQFEKLDECRKFKDIINNKAFVLVEGIDSLFQWEKYRGSVKIKKEGVKNPPELGDIKSLLYEELKSNKKFEITGLEYIKNEGSILIALNSNGPINLPENYKEVREFQEFTNISFNLIGINKEKIIKIEKDNNIKIQSIKEIKF